MAEDLRIVLLANAGSWVGFREIEERCSISSAGFRSRLSALVQEGCEFDEDESRGVRLKASPDLLMPSEVNESAAGLRTPFRVEHLASVESTSDEAWARFDTGAGEGTVVSADSQTAGRGRGGNRWHSSPCRGLWFSAILVPPSGPAGLSGITCLAGVAAARAIEDSCGIRARIKWPNDVWAGGRKICGILAETRSRGPSPWPVVLGFGINVNQAPGEFPAELAAVATSARIETGRMTGRTALLSAVLTRLDAWYGRFKDGGIGSIESEYSALSLMHGRAVRFAFGRETVQGTVVRVSCVEGIALSMPGGATRFFRAEHVSGVEFI